MINWSGTSSDDVIDDIYLFIYINPFNWMMRPYHTDWETGTEINWFSNLLWFDSWTALVFVNFKLLDRENATFSKLIEFFYEKLAT